MGEQRYLDRLGWIPFVLLLPCTTLFFSVLADALGAELWDPDPAPVLFVVFGLAFLLQLTAAACSISYLRAEATEARKYRTRGLLITLVTLAVLFVGMLINS